jgi:hypothetical protein
MKKKTHLSTRCAKGGDNRILSTSETNLLPNLLSKNMTEPAKHDRIESLLTHRTSKKNIVQN